MILTGTPALICFSWYSSIISRWQTASRQLLIISSLVITSLIIFRSRRHSIICSILVSICSSAALFMISLAVMVSPFLVRLIYTMNYSAQCAQKQAHFYVYIVGFIVYTEYTIVKLQARGSRADGQPTRAT